MALAELRRRLSSPLQRVSDTNVLRDDKKTLNSCLKEITTALLDADFPTLFVNELEKELEAIINSPYKRRRIYQIVFDQLRKILDSGNSALMPGKREGSSIVMFIGLKGVDKSKTCAKYASFHRQKGFRPAVLCADTFTTGLVPTPSYRIDSVMDGIQKLMKDKHDLIIVDTNGSHGQLNTLFIEMHRISESINADVVILVLDSSIGQTAASDQAAAFKDTFKVGVVMFTNNSKAKVGVLSAVAAAKCPIILAETEEMNEEFESFQVEPFVMGLLGIPLDPQHRHGDMSPISIYTLRRMYFYLQSASGMDNLFTPLTMPKPQELEVMIRYLTIMDSMTDEELDGLSVDQLDKNEDRKMEIATKSKVDVKQVSEMIQTYKILAKRFRDQEKEMRDDPHGHGQRST